MKALGTQRRWLMAMGGAFGPNLSLAKVIWRGLTIPEASVLDLVRLAQGSAFSLRLLIRELLDANLQRDVRRLEAPVFFMLGRLDMQAVASVAAAYFEVLEAPHKVLIWFEASGHMAPFEEPELFNRLMVETVRPFAC
jgi:proline iminopeptidase